MKEIKCILKKSVGLFAFVSAIFFAGCQDEDDRQNNTNNDSSTDYPATPDVIHNAVTDIDGNSYDAVRIGEQVWMASNLRTKHYSNGDVIPFGQTHSSTEPYWYKSSSTYGCLYNWVAVMHGEASSGANPSGVQGICPTGWHVPSDAEWKQMEMSVGMSQSDADNTGSRGNIAAKLSGNTGWTASTTDNAAGNLDAPNRNSTGFSALPAGYYGTWYCDRGYRAGFWSATSTSETYALKRSLYYSSATVHRGGYGKGEGNSVRCLRD